MRSVEFDMSAIAKWAECAEEMLNGQREKFLEETAKLMASELLQRLKKNTPVGNYSDYVEFTTNPTQKTKEVSFTTNGGKDVFFIARNPPKAVKFKSLLAGKTGGTLREGWRIREIRKVSDGYEIELFNNIHYAAHVEYGHRIMNKKGGTRYRTGEKPCNFNVFAV